MENHLYEYAVVRYVPRVEREEFINVGLIMMCKRKRWIRVEFVVNADRLCSFDNAITIDDLQRQLMSFTRICSGDRLGGPMASMEVEERFRWLTAVRSACVQTSRPHPGKTPDLDITFMRLLHELVE